MHVRLRVPDGGVIAVSHGLRIGRDPTNDLVLDSSSVSRRHAVLVQIQGRMAIHDERSTNGTFVNNQRVRGTVGIEPGDAIRIGSYTLLVEAEPNPAPAPALASMPPVSPAAPAATRLKGRRVVAIGRITGVYVVLGVSALAVLLVLALTAVARPPDQLKLPTPVAVFAPETPRSIAAANPSATAAAAPDWADVFEQTAPNVVVVTNQAASTSGTGFFVDEHHALTNAHVVNGASSVRVSALPPKGGTERTTRSARVLAADTTMDLAVLSLADASPSHLTLASLDRVRVGDEVMAVGEPRGLAWSATFGRVGALRRGGEFDLNPTLTALQFDAAVNPGNSGGPLIARDGGVIGIVTFGMRNATGLSFAIAGDPLWARAREWIARGTVAL